MTRRARGQRRTDLVHHGKIVDWPGAVDGDEGGGVRPPEDVRQVTGAKAGVDGHHHGANFGQGEERIQPSGRLGIHRATRSPACIPSAIKALAVRSTSVRRWAKLQRWPAKVSASLVLQRPAASSNKVPNVFFAYQSCMSCLPVRWLPGPVTACGATAPRGASRDGAPHT